MTIVLRTNSLELSFSSSVHVHVVFGDDPITKMRDSLPMVLFQFEILV
jgi:hypothetical protein